MNNVFTSYLEYLTPREKAKAYKQGQTGLRPDLIPVVPKIAKPEKIDVKILEHVTSNKKIETEKDYWDAVMEFKKYRGRHIWKIKNGNEIEDRAVITDNGIIYTCDNNSYTVHNEMMVKMLLDRVIDLDFKEWDNWWRAYSDSKNKFLCIMRSRGNKFGLSESYKIDDIYDDQRAKISQSAWFIKYAKMLAKFKITLLPHRP